MAFFTCLQHELGYMYFSVSQLNRFDPCEGRSALLISALHSPIKAVHPGVFSTYFHVVSNKSPRMPKLEGMRRLASARGLEMVQMSTGVPEGKASSLTAVLPLLPTV